ncbi:YxiJ-like family protein [Pseudobacillus badius]|uniref:YxiJ-like family protein n=1 Tax=Bacillus badius TaxID=1455 RepID=UPI001CC15FDC|nr:YxiJ-like family protein [Bacillus badius]UAT29029.1 YxiJ-like family protein [Bacillus badius]GLY12554.1 hypothetical protein Bbad01_37700 [Bacillus badius]
MKATSNAEIKAKLQEINFVAPFPSEDLKLIEENHRDGLLYHTDEITLTEDFHNFLFVIAGSASYILSGKRIPKHQKQFLEKGFFECYPAYRFLEKLSDKYPDFSEELKRHELARQLLVKC